MDIKRTYPLNMSYIHSGGTRIDNPEHLSIFSFVHEETDRIASHPDFYTDIHKFHRNTLRYHQYTYSFPERHIHNHSFYAL